MDRNTTRLWFTDNGAVYCTDHLGSSARYTGRDLSGQPIEEVTPEYVQAAARQGISFRCEIPSCRREASALHLP